ncbi:MAG: FecR family protein [Tannerellaceae bacterium]|jgi:ferric-dicitrate binding protein FerR (iron transport regulator)|nr:FecR family protein [Tannerellaceae bacterium]
MNKLSLKLLLEKLMSRQITRKEFVMLKDDMKNSQDKDIDSALHSIWESSTNDTLMSIDVKERIRYNITRQVVMSERKKTVSWIQIVAVIAIPILFCLGSYYYFSSKYAFEPETFVVFTEKGQRTQLLLPDGTHVWLNSGSRLCYDTDFNKNSRNVELEGEAFFDVSQNKNSTFKVKTSNVNVLVHGTAFNVSAYRNEETINVFLVRGKISVENNADNQLLAELLPDQRISVSKMDMKWRVESCDAEMESLWTQNMLKFENVPATEVFRKLAYWYRMNINIENLNKDIRYGFTLKSESLKEILDEINKITPINYKINGKEATIKYK